MSATAGTDKSVLARQHQIEQDQIDPAILKRAFDLAALRQDRHPKIGSAKIATDKAADFGVIFDQKNVRHARIRWMSAGGQGQRKIFVSECFRIQFGNTGKQDYRRRARFH